MPNVRTSAKGGRKTQTDHAPYSCSSDLQLVKRQWPRVTRLLSQEHQTLPSLPRWDPLNQHIDLLSPLSADNDEVLHTRALAYLLDPVRPHGFDTHLLRGLIRRLRGVPNVRERQLNGILRLLGRTEREREIVVIPEYRHLVKGAKKQTYPRTDIWIEIHAGRSSRLIVIENKIEARESDLQLTSYEALAKEWRKKHPSGRPLLIFLTPDGKKPRSGTAGKWVALPYAELAGMLRRTWLAHKSAPGGEWLRLYLASILHQNSRSASRGASQIEFLKSYLGHKR